MTKKDHENQLADSFDIEQKIESNEEKTNQDENPSELETELGQETKPEHDLEPEPDKETKPGNDLESEHRDEPAPEKINTMENNPRVETIAAILEFPVNWAMIVDKMYQPEHVDIIKKIFSAPPGPHMTNLQLKPLARDFFDRLAKFEEE